MNERPSGGARATAKKRAAEAAADERKPDYKARTIAARRVLAAIPTDPGKLGGVVALHIAALAREAELDPGPAPEATREQAARLWALAGKNVETAKMRAELDELIAHLSERADRKPNAPPVIRDEDGGGAGESQH